MLASAWSDKLLPNDKYIFIKKLDISTAYSEFDINNK